MDKDKNWKEGVPPPPSQGLRRSARLRKVPPPPPSRGGGSGRDRDTASERKRPRPQLEDCPLEGVSAVVAADVNVQVSPSKVDASLASNSGGGGEDSENGSGCQRSLFGGQPPQLGNETARTKVGGSIGKREESSSSLSSLVLRGTAGSSEVRSSEASAEEEEEAHPCLFIENILEVVFNHVINQPGPRTIIATDARHIRLVCQTWRTSMTRLYRQTRPPTVFVRYDLRGHPGRGMNTLNQFMKTMSSSSMIPVQKYNFGMRVFRRNNLKEFREFLLLCGPETVELTMTISGARDSERIMASLENLPSLEMRKLKSLLLFVTEEYRPQNKVEDHGLVKLLEVLLIAAKALLEVKLDYRPQAYLEAQRIQQALVIQQLSLVIAKGMAGTVKKLELYLRMNEPASTILAEMQPKLERLELQVGPDLGGTALFKFLQSQSTTLKHLQFWTLYGTGGIFIQFPRLDELIDLRLQDVIPVITDPSHFGESFPKLNCLHVSGTRSEDAFRALLSTVKKPSQSLKVLHLPVLYRNSLAPFIKNVAQSFPCLAELRMTMCQGTEETMMELFQYCDNLESLHIFVFQLIQNAYWADSIFSGIPETDCDRIRGLQDFGTVNLEGIRRQPSILNLTRLKKLIVTGTRRIAFTDLSAHFAFLAMDNLREINLANSAAQFSPKYLELLRGKLVLRG